MDLSDAEIARARRRAARSRKAFPQAISARFDARAFRLEIELSNGVRLSLDPRDVEGLERATAVDLAEVVLQGSGTGVHFPLIDADLYVPGLLSGRLGSRSWMAAQLGARGGRARSPAKGEAARENGRKGGRPRKKVEAAEPAASATPEFA